MKMPEKCTGPKLWTKSWQNGEDDSWEAMIWSEERTDMEKSWYGAESVRDTRGTEWDRMVTKEYGKMLKRIQVVEDGRVPAKEARNWRIEGQKRKNHKKAVSEASEQV